MLVAAAVAVPAVVLAAWLVYDAQRHHRWLLEQQLSETARALSLVVDRQIGQAEALLKGLVSSPHLERGDYAAFYAQARAVVPGPSQWIVLEGADGQQIANTRLPWGALLPQGAQTPLEYAPVLGRGGTHVSDLFQSRVQANPVLAVGLPIFRDGRFHQTLMLVLQPEHFSSVLSDQQVPAEWVASIIDRQGLIVARTRGAALHMGKPATEDVRAAIRREPSAVLRSRTLDGVESIAAFNRSPQFGWTVIVGAPVSAVSAPAWRLGLVAAAVAFLLMAIGVAVSVYVARAILRSVSEVVDAAGRLGGGEGVVATDTGMRETDQVAAALHASSRELRQRADELRALNQTLETRVDERTAELAAANRALSIRNRELQDFAQIAAHDLQEPVRHISAFAELLHEECSNQLSGQPRFYVDRMQAAARRLARLISDLLAFTSITANVRATVDVDLNAVLADVRSDLEGRRAETAGLIEAAPLLPVHGDPVQVHHVLLNLVGNALKFHRPGVPPHVRIRTEAEGSLVRVIVEDNGTGFNPALAARLFSPFERLHSRAEYEGTGIGLAIVRRIAERHGGTVAASSKPGEGSRFEVTLPAVPKR
jgi:signal transduction histidine kinase